MKKIQALAYNSITMFTTLLLILSCNLGIFKNTSTVSFTYGGQSKTTRSIKEVPDVEPNEIIYINGIDSDSPLQHIPLNVGANELELSKKGINLIGFAYNPSVAKGRGKGPKEISSGIMGLGNLSIVTAGLDSLPLAGSAANDFNLGSIAGDSQSYQSLISKTELEQATGYSTDDLDIYSFYDNSFLKLLNPDIDKNGVYDVDEGVYWKLTALRKVPTFYLDDFDKMTEQFIPEFRLDAPRSPDDKVAPEIPHNGDKGHKAHHKQGRLQDIGHGVAAFSDYIHGSLYQSGNEYLCGVHGHQ